MNSPSFSAFLRGAIARGAAIIMAVLVSSCEKQVVEVETGYKGPARSNSLLAAERYLESNGFQVDDSRHAPTWKERSGVIIASSHSLQSRRSAVRAAGWVSRGGHLIYLQDFEDLNRKSGGKTGRERQESTPFLAFVGADVSFGKRVMCEIEIGEGSKLRADFEAGPRFHVLTKDWRVIRALDDQPSPYISYRFGEGRVTLVSLGSIWKNRDIGENAHAELLLRTARLRIDGVAQTEPPIVTVSRGGRYSFATLLWEHGWMASVALGVGLGLWIWKTMLRTVPIGRQPEAGERQFHRHLQLSGRLFWRHGQADTLLEAAREDIRSHASRRWFSGRDPAPGELSGRLAEISGLTPRECDEAMTPFSPDHIAVTPFVHVARNLQKILQNL